VILKELVPKFDDFQSLNPFRSLIAPTFHMTQSVMIRNIARWSYQAIFVDGVGLESLFVDFCCICIDFKLQIIQFSPVFEA